MQHRLLVFAKRDVSVVLKRQKVARVGGLVVNRDLGTGVMGNKGGLVSTFVVEKEGFATTCTAINAHLWVAGVPWARARRRRHFPHRHARENAGCGDSVAYAGAHRGHRSRPGREDRRHAKKDNDTHRPAHEGKFHERMDALEEILKKAKVLRSDIAVLAGDLNWRLDTDHVWDGSVEHCIREGDWKSLREADELVRAHEQHGVLSDWTVPVCDFPPTFKLKPGGLEYDPKRLPAWCDRVLFRADTTIRTVVRSHRSFPVVDTSDHRPVGLELTIQDPSKIPESRIRSFGKKIRRSFGRILPQIREDQSPRNQRPGLETFRSKFGGSIFTSIAGHGHPEFSDTDDEESEAASDVSASSDDEESARFVASPKSDLRSPENVVVEGKAWQEPPS